MFIRSDTTWSEQQVLRASDFGISGDNFGFSVSLSGDGNTALIGAFGKNSFQGAAYVFARSDTTWSQQKLTASDGAIGDYFGTSVSLSEDGNTALIGAYGKNSAQGAAYVFTRGTIWSQQVELTASDGAASDNFGLSVFLSSDGNTALIGAYGKNSQQGAAYVFPFRTAPNVVTGLATNITVGTATLNGTVNANNASTTVTFQYGLDTNYGTTVTADQSPVTGTSATAVSKTITGLTPNTTYHYRVVGVNSAGTTYGSDMTFTTSSRIPTAITSAASGVTDTGATLNGTVNPKGLSTTYYFEWGPSTAYENTTPSQSADSGTSDMAVSANLTGLTSNITYHYRLVATNQCRDWVWIGYDY